MAARHLGPQEVATLQIADHVGRAPAFFQTSVQNPALDEFNDRQRGQDDHRQSKAGHRLSDHFAISADAAENEIRQQHIDTDQERSASR
jgi:hypothetical protein